MSEPRRFNSVEELRDAHRGHFCEKRCPKCGATLLRNKLGDEWCSFIHCDFGIEDRRGKPASPALDRLKEAVSRVMLSIHNQRTAWGETTFLNMAEDQINEALRIIEELKHE